MELLKASGLWDEHITPQAIDAVSAFYRRPWAGHDCTLDEVCVWSATCDIDPEPLMRMLVVAGELHEDI